ALTAALRAEVMLIYVGAQRHGIALRIAHVDPSFDHPSRGPFDGKYMQALYEVGVAAGKKGTAFGDTLPELSMHGSGSRQYRPLTTLRSPMTFRRRSIRRVTATSAP